MARSRMNLQKAAALDNIPRHELRVCSLELADVFTDIFNLSLAQASVATCFKSTTIVPLPKKDHWGRGDNIQKRGGRTWPGVQK